MFNIGKTFSRTRKQLVKVSVFCAALLPVVIIGWLITQYWVNVPYYDQWGTPGIIFEKIHEGTLSFKDLVAQHNESRKLFPRLFFISLAYLTKWNIKYELIGILMIACAISISIYRLSQLTLSIDRLTALALLIPVNMLIFSPVQWENLLWGIQIIVFVPILCILLCLIVSYSNLNLPKKIILCAALSTISTYSYANGMLCWIASLVALLLSEMERGVSINKIKIRLLPYVSIFLLIIATYFYDYHKPAQHPSLVEAVVHPIQALAYFTAFLGSPLSAGKLGVAIVIGTVAAILFCLLSLYCLINFKRTPQLLRSAYAWIIVGCYTLASALITMVGRVGFGIEQSLASRYTTFSICLYIATIYLIVALLSQSPHLDNLTRLKLITGLDNQIIPSSLLSCFLTATIVLHLLTFAPAVQLMQIAMRDRLYLKACLTYIHFSDSTCKPKLFPDIPTLEKRADAINAMGFLDPKLAETPVVTQAKAPKGSPKNENGWFDKFSQTAPSQYMGGGWATLPDQKKAADAVLLTYKSFSAGSEDSNWRVFAVAPIQIRRDDVADFFNQPSYQISGWETSFSTQALPKGEIRLRAWAYNTKTGEAFKLRTTHQIQN